MSEKITVPTLGESVTEATVSKWLKSQGDKVVADEPIVELETDKVNVEVPAQSNGILGSIAVKEGETVNVGSLLGTINDQSSQEANIPKEIKKYNPPKKNVSKEQKLFEQEIKKPTPKKVDKSKLVEPVLKLDNESITNEQEPLILNELHKEKTTVKKSSSVKKDTLLGIFLFFNFLLQPIQYSYPLLWVILV